METKKIIIFIIIIIILGIALLLVMREVKGNILVITDKNEYSLQDHIRVQIQNKSGRNACFSSCYPYLIERKDGSWNQYEYADCAKTDLTNLCLAQGEKKAFELALPSIVSGLHRLALGVCLGCQVGEVFKGDKKFYSNEFLIK